MLAIIFAIAIGWAISEMLDDHENQAERLSILESQMRPQNPFGSRDDEE